MTTWGQTTPVGGHIANWALAYFTQRITILSAAVIESISVMTFAAGASDHVVFGLYDDDYTNATPGTKLAETNVVSLAGTGSNTTTTANLITPYNAAAGNYWLYCKFELNTSDVYYVNGGGVSTSTTGPYPSVPANLSNPTIAAWLMTLYASGTGGEASLPPGGGGGGGNFGPGKGPGKGGGAGGLGKGGGNNPRSGGGGGFHSTVREVQEN